MIFHQTRFPLVFMIVFIVAILSLSTITHAQKKNQDISQLLDHVDAPLAYNPSLLDYREEMRRFIQSISEYGRQKKPNFVIIAKNGLDLLIKRNIYNDMKTPKARTYIRAIDGILQEGMFFSQTRGSQAFETPQIYKIQKRMLR